MVDARPRTWSLLAAVAIAIGTGFALGWPQQAAAHAVLERSIPVQNQKLPAALPPALVETWYSEPLERSFTKVKVLDTLGSEVQSGETLFSDDAFYAAVALPPELPPGVYTVSYQNVSTVDGHVWGGTFGFIVLNADGSVPQGAIRQGGGPGQQGFLPGVGDSTLRWFEMLAAVAMAGAAGFYLLVLRPSAEFLSDEEKESVQSGAMALAADIVVMAVPVLALASFGQVLLLADRLGGAGAIDNILFDTRTGQLWLARIGVSIALGLLFVPALRSEQFRSSSHASIVVVMALLGSLGLLMTYSLASHAGAGGGAFWGVGADFVHFVATAAWLGALLQLPLVFWWTKGRLDSRKRLLYMANVLDRFAWLAVISVALLIGTGVFNGFVQLPNFHSLYDTTYGRVLIVKLALILPLLGIGGINAIFLSPALSDAIDALYEEEAEGQLSANESLRVEARLHRLQATLPRTALLELVIGVAVLVSVAILTQTTTAIGEVRQDAGKPSGQYETSVDAGDLKVNLKIQPFGVGLGTFTVGLASTSGQLGDVLGVQLRAFFDDPNKPPTAGISGTFQDLQATSDPAAWSADAALLTQPGDWRLQARVRIRGQDDVVGNLSVPEVGGALARLGQPKSLFDLPFTYVDWNIVAGGAMIVLGFGTFLIWRNRPSVWQQSTSGSVFAASGFAFIAGVVLLFGVHAHQRVGADIRNPVRPDTASITKGQQIFQNNCQVCHGATGEGDGPGAASLNVKPPRYVDHVPYHGDGTLFLWISEGIPLNSDVKNMPGWKSSLSVEDRWNVVNFLRATFGSGQFKPVLPSDLAGTPAPGG